MGSMKYFFQKIKNSIFPKLVFLLALSFTPAISAEAASVSIKSDATIVEGSRFTVDVLVDSEDKAFNSVDMTLVYPPNAVSFNGFSTEQSGVGIWVEQPKERSPGTLHFSGVIPGGVDRLFDPLHAGNTAIPIVRLFFIAQKEGAAQFAFQNIVVLENDGKGTALPIKITPRDIVVIPATKDTTPYSQEDTAPPEPFTVTIIERSLFGKTPRLAVFSANDTTGGIARYEASVGSLPFHEVTSPMPLPYRLFSYTLSIRAFDFSGNVQEQRITVSGERAYGLGIVVLIVAAIFFFVFWKKNQKKKNPMISVVLGIILSLGMYSDSFASGAIVLIPSQKEVEIGKQFSVAVVVQSPSQAMNAVSGKLNINGGASVSAVGSQQSIINFWTTEPRTFGKQVHFEGIVLNPGYQGNNGKLFTLTLTARKEGIVTFDVSEGAVLANDGLGSNIIGELSSVAVKVVPAPVIAYPQLPFAKAEVAPGKTMALPVITEYSASVSDTGVAFLKGKGEPNALTKLSFKDVSLKSLGEQFVSALQTKKKKPTEALVKNDAQGFFQYTSTDNLIAGVYNVTPFLVDEDTQTQKPGFGIQFLVSNSKLVRWLVVLINILILLIPVAALLVLIYFIPWYSRLRMRILRHRIKIEDEELTLSEKELQAKEAHIEKRGAPSIEKDVLQ